MICFILDILYLPSYLSCIHYTQTCLYKHHIGGPSYTLLHALFLVTNKNREKSISMTAPWCPAFNNHD